jgi:hypothetical protein
VAMVHLARHAAAVPSARVAFAASLTRRPTRARVPQVRRGTRAPKRTNAPPASRA